MPGFIYPRYLQEAKKEKKTKKKKQALFQVLIAQVLIQI